MIKATVRSDTKVLKALEDGSLFKTRAAPVLKQVAQSIIDDIRSSWSPIVPSSYGEPPAVRTGNLDRSIRKGEPRDTGGRFAGGSGLVIGLYAEASYAGILEYGPLYRPFFEPALDRAAERFGLEFKTVFVGIEGNVI